MSTFAQLAAMPGVGVAMLLDVSLDGGVSIAYRWSTVDVEFGGEQYSERIAECGPVSADLGNSSTFGSRTVSILLDNADLAAGFLASAASYASVALGEFTLSLLLYNPLDHSDMAAEGMGVFGCLDPPVRDDSTVRLELSSSSAMSLLAPIRPPSYRHWAAAEGLSFVSPTDGFDVDSQVPLRFGEMLHPTQRVTALRYAMCATREPAATALTGIWLGAGIQLPMTLPSVITSPVIAVDGEAWYVKSFDVNLEALGLQDEIKLRYPEAAAALWTVPPGELGSTPDIAAAYRALDTIGLYFSATGLSNTAPSATFGTGAPSSAAIAYSLLADHTALGASGVDIASFLSAKPGSGTPSFSVDGGVSYSSGGILVREGLQSEVAGAVSALAGFGGFAVVPNGSGVVRAVNLPARLLSVPASTASIAPDMMARTSDCVPGASSRFRPVGGAVVRSAGSILGPFMRPVQDSSLRNLASIDATMAASAEGAAVTRGQASAVAMRLLDQVAVRPMLRFSAPLDLASVLPGDVISAEWSRGGYLQSSWMVERISIDAMSCVVDIECVWLATTGVENAPVAYVLDNESLSERVTSAEPLSSSTVVTDGSSTVTLGLPSGTLPADYDIATGDILVLRDASEAAQEFARNRAMRITSVSAVAATVTIHGSTDFGSSGAHSVASWGVYRGATTYPSPGDDPVNYPSGGRAYGKVSDSSDYGKFSDDSSANPLTG